VDYENIVSQRQLTDFCNSLRDANIIGFDTEFVSEDTFRPDLCLIQVVSGNRLAVIDPKAVADVTPFWELLATGNHETVVHAGREELRFCLSATGRRPHDLFDLQIAAGLVGIEYPAAYSTLVRKILNSTLPKGETRSNWRRRPLSQRQ
jgi:ribonuclease D